MATVKINNNNNIIKNNNDIQNNNFDDKENNLNKKGEINKGINTERKILKEKKHIKSSSTIPVYYPILNKSKINNKNTLINSGLNIIKNNNHTIQSYNQKSREKNKKIIDSKDIKENLSYVEKISNDEIYYYLKPQYKQLEKMIKHINGFVEFNRFKDKLKIEMKYHFFKNKFLRNKNKICYK